MSDFSLSDSEHLLFQAALYDCKNQLADPGNKQNFKEILDAIVVKYLNIVDSDKLREFLESGIKIPIDPTSIITGKKAKGKTWFTDFKKQNRASLKYWNRYETYLSKKSGFTLDTIYDIDVSTNKTMNAMADPSLDCPQAVHGLAFGYVQSGKTAHYLALINKAVDAGYNVIIVLTGIYKNLRIQTQIRLEEDFLGYDSCSKINIGVGVERPFEINLNTLTTRENNGDFNKMKSGTSITPPLVFVSQKNKTILTNLYNYLRNSPNIKKSENKISTKYSLLLIDDEADQASLNTKKEDYDPTTINKLIRKLLNLFNCYSYVAYTATPFANIFIQPFENHKTLGKDLFPEDFIVNIPRPKEYIGAIEYFGLKDDYTNFKAMPLFREISKGKNYLLDKNVDDSLKEIPAELKSSIKDFIMSIAIKNLRGMVNKPNSMLIHIIRYKQQQIDLKRKVKDYVDLLKSYITNGDKNTKDEFHSIWSEYSNTTELMKKYFSKFMNNIPCLSWEKVYGEIVRFLREDPLEIYCINGNSTDALVYENHKDSPFNVIVIGGDKLSRGLTLEGLTVSYFTRQSNTYDTLMQMGRWFGYRKGYIDLCRLYTTASLHCKFITISRATEDLIRQIDFMNDIVNQTPKDFGLAVETDPDLLITNKTKLRTGKEIKRDFSNNLSQTRVIDLDSDTINNNYDAVDMFLRSIGHPLSNEIVRQKLEKETIPEHYHFYWFGIEGEGVAKFLEAFKTSKYASRAKSKYMADYIRSQLKVGGLTNWNVCLLNVNYNDKTSFSIGGIKGVGKGISRTTTEYSSDDNVCDLHTLLSKDHEYLDYSMSLMKKVNSEYSNASSTKIRQMTRDRSNGLLLIYPLGDIKPITELQKKTKCKKVFAFAVVFPDRLGKGEIKSYRINDIAVQDDDYEVNE